MKYMGSKSRLAKHILPIILKDRGDSFYVEPFAGGMNIIDKVDGKRIANDVNIYLIDMWKALTDGWIPSEYSREEYIHIRDNKNIYPNHLVGYAGFCLSYCGKWFGGYAGITSTRDGIRDYQKEAKNNILKQVKQMKGVVFSNTDYWEMDIPSGSTVYCDPPYAGTTEYKDSGFNHSLFWKWVREISEDSRVFVSEYNAPEDFKCVWQKEVASSLSANGSSGGNKKSIEKLFVIGETK